MIFYAISMLLAYIQVLCGMKNLFILILKLVKKYKNQICNQRNAILKRKYYNSKNLIIQHNPVKEKVKKIDVFE